jgi:hypothetical protein
MTVLPIEVIANCRLPIANWYFAGSASNAVNRQLAIGNRQCSYVAD